MSDIEDGELFSDDGDECLEEENHNLKMKTSIDNFNTLNTEDSSDWIYEHKYNKATFYNRSSDSEDEYTQQSICDQKNIYDDKNSLNKPDNYDNRNSRKRSFDYIKVDSSQQNDVPPPKRRILCKYYASGDCQNGALCTFMHEEFPCKFYHDENATCRSENNCKFSHKPLTDEMKNVLEEFIQEGKEKLIHTAVSTIKNASFINSFSLPQSRPNCLLPTPRLTEGLTEAEYDPDFSNSYREISNYPSVNRVTSSKMFDIIPNYPIANKSLFLQKIFKSEAVDSPKPNISLTCTKGNGKLSQSEESISSFLKKLHRIIIPDDRYYGAESNEENIVPDMIPKPIKQLNSKIHAPARFIISNEQNIKVEPNEEEPPDFDSDYREALRKLANQIVVEPKPLVPDSEKTNSVDYSRHKSISNSTHLLNTYNLKELMEFKNSGLRLNESMLINKDELQMNESENKSNDKIKNHEDDHEIQIENIMPWNIKKLDDINKQPYLLYVLKLSDVHDNPLADPRLIGHPVLNYHLRKEMKSAILDDKDEYSPLSLLREEDLDNEHSDSSA